MRWRGNRESENIEDRRGSGGGGGFGLGGKSIGIGGVIVALIVSWVFGINPSTVLSLMGGGGAPVQQQADTPTSKPQDEAGKFVSVVLADTEDTWTAQFKEHGQAYQPPHLVLFERATGTACGTGQSATGPFYCPLDRKVYLDVSFFQELEKRFGVNGEFAQAYVVAHEIGHHVQKLTGVSDKVEASRKHSSSTMNNAMSVRVELQADCYAGVWANHANRSRQILEQGDVEAALKAASAIGDDAIQAKTQGQVVPDSFTHGSSAQRVRWFRTGLESGSIEQCDTFDTDTL
ncbi:KPN_02809 family neutral zinc metallopeptidase [Massilia endophytica]|uniref:KPN_02809 family neutral zinc metallopeptidase n=1 Tax=Massilia endophytica TaxID=2899220 RepID=UPI001E5EA648|nr:neutral zinc metallopeptidase [Massilia endophytica]UGQ48239.1 neutral zinc metallopeptidase [Massilia endophytica]